MHDLVNTPEMYLRTIFDLEEEGVTPMRSRIAERLGQSGPTVSQTVGRLERDGLVTIDRDRRLLLTGPGRDAANRITRKHRLAEILLYEIIGLEWELVHTEACRLEHVLGFHTERKLAQMVTDPTRSAYGCEIPMLDELGVDVADRPTHGRFQRADESVGPDGITGVVWRIDERLQFDKAALADLRRAGIQPFRRVHVKGRNEFDDGQGSLVCIDGADNPVILNRADAHAVVIDVQG